MRQLMRRFIFLGLALPIGACGGNTHVVTLASVRATAKVSLDRTQDYPTVGSRKTTRL